MQSKKLLAEVQRAIQSSEQKAIKWRAIHADKAAILAKALEDLRAATAAFEAMRADLQGGIDVARPQIESHKARPSLSLRVFALSLSLPSDFTFDFTSRIGHVQSELLRLAHEMAELQWQDTELEKKEDDLSGQLKAINKQATLIQAILEKLECVPNC